MATIAEIAEAVKVALAGGSFGQSFIQNENCSHP